MSNLKGVEIKYTRYYLHSSIFGVQILKPLASASSDFGVVVQTFTVRDHTGFDRLIPVRAGDGPWNASPGRFTPGLFLITWNFKNRFSI